MKNWKKYAIFGLLLVTGCGGSSDKAPATPVDVLANVTVPTTYSFKNKFDQTKSSVAYSGQTLRQVLIKELSIYVKSLTVSIDTGATQPVQGDVLSALNFYYEFDSNTSGGTAFGFTTTPAVKQLSFSEIATVKNLKEKLAGNDLVGQHKDWTTEFKGWDDTGVTGVAGSVVTPEDLLISFFTKLDQIAANRAAGNPELDPDGVAITTAHVTSDGLNMQELIEKFLLGAVAYSQAIDDYLDDDLAGKGLNADNIAKDSGTADYTALEHGWDEAFGYYGASQDYENYTDAVLGASGGNYKDTNGDSAIDLNTEYIYSLASYANKRDLASNVDAPTNFSKEIFDAFLKGRAIINSASGNLNTDEMVELKKQRTIIANTWEKIIASNMLHYLNTVIVDLDLIGSTTYKFASHAGHWSEMKGFALCFQFNPKKLMTQANFELIHGKIGVKPVISTDGAVKIATYRADLLAVRKILQDTYSFHAKNVGDDNGLNGW